MASRGRNVAVSVACLTIIAGFGLLPSYVMKNSAPMTYKEGPLTGSQRMRGLYQANGSVDVGRDPDWDPKTNTWVGERVVIAASKNSELDLPSAKAQKN